MDLSSLESSIDSMEEVLLENRSSTLYSVNCLGKFCSSVETVENNLKPILTLTESLAVCEDNIEGTSVDLHDINFGIIYPIDDDEPEISFSEYLGTSPTAFQAETAALIQCCNLLRKYWTKNIPCSSYFPNVYSAVPCMQQPSIFYCTKIKSQERENKMYIFYLSLCLDTNILHESRPYCYGEQHFTLRSK